MAEPVQAPFAEVMEAAPPSAAASAPESPAAPSADAVAPLATVDPMALLSAPLPNGRPAPVVDTVTGLPVDPPAGVPGAAPGDLVIMNDGGIGQMGSDGTVTPVTAEQIAAHPHTEPATWAPCSMDCRGLAPDGCDREAGCLSTDPLQALADGTRQVYLEEEVLPTDEALALLLTGDPQGYTPAPDVEPTLEVVEPVALTDLLDVPSLEALADLPPADQAKHIDAAKAEAEGLGAVLDAIGELTEEDLAEDELDPLEVPDRGRAGIAPPTIQSLGKAISQAVADRIAASDAALEPVERIAIGQEATAVALAIDTTQADDQLEQAVVTTEKAARTADQRHQADVVRSAWMAWCKVALDIPEAPPCPIHFDAALAIYAAVLHDGDTTMAEHDNAEHAAEAEQRRQIAATVGEATTEALAAVSAPPAAAEPNPAIYATASRVVMAPAPTPTVCEHGFTKRSQCMDCLSELGPDLAETPPAPDITQTLRPERTMVARVESGCARPGCVKAIEPGDIIGMVPDIGWCCTRCIGAEAVA